MADILPKGETINKVVLIDIALIKPNRSQPRTNFDLRELESLASSIIENGLLQPLTVRRMENHFELISGERRLRALVIAKATQAPCIIVEVGDEQSAMFALLENLQRADLNYFEEAVAIKCLMDEWGLSQQELGARLGKAQSTIANKLRLLRFNEQTRNFFISSKVTERQARALLRLEDTKALSEAIEAVITKKLNVAQTEKLVESLLTHGASPRRVYHPIVKDVRIFINTITNAVSLMNQSGIKAVSEKKDCGDYIEYIVKIPNATT